MRSPITTHVLDTSRGRPAADILVVLEHQVAGGDWKFLGSDHTNSDGRATALLATDAVLEAGVYRLTFAADQYFAAANVQSFYASIPIVFRVEKDGGHYHVPLLLSPFGYSTYRGS